MLSDINKSKELPICEDTCNSPLKTMNMILVGENNNLIELYLD